MSGSPLAASMTSAKIGDLPGHRWPRLRPDTSLQGVCLRTMRKAWMTPSGSLKESNRETCKMMGLSRSIPRRSRTAWISSGGQFPVLFAQRVNGGTDEILGMRQVLGKLGHGKDRGVILTDDFPQKFPDLEVGPGDIDMTAPDPVFGLGPHFLNEIGRLGVVHQDEVGFPGKLAGVFPVDSPCSAPTGPGVNRTFWPCRAL